MRFWTLGFFKFYGMDEKDATIKFLRGTYLGEGTWVNTDGESTDVSETSGKFHTVRHRWQGKNTGA